MSKSPIAPPPPDDIVFHGFANQKADNLPTDLDLKTVNLSGTASIYYVYPAQNPADRATPSPIQIVTSTTPVPVTVKPPRSLKGFSKIGVILFETLNYGGESQNYVGDVARLEDTFPNGVSSFNVISGTWSFYLRDNFGGAAVVIDGSSKFGPGTRAVLPAKVKIRSVKRISEFEAPPPPDDIILHGLTNAHYHQRADNLPTDLDFTTTNLSGDGSIYYLYPTPSQAGHSTPSAVQVVTSTTPVPIINAVKPPRSLKGFSKTGVILFETFNYGGASKNYDEDVACLANSFPSGAREGVSSFHVISGTWSFYLKDDFGGGAANIGGKSSFGPGTRISLDKVDYAINDRIKSVKRISE